MNVYYIRRSVVFSMIIRPNLHKLFIILIDKGDEEAARTQHRIWTHKALPEIRLLVHTYDARTPENALF